MSFHERGEAVAHFVVVVDVGLWERTHLISKLPIYPHIRQGEKVEYSTEAVHHIDHKLFEDHQVGGRHAFESCDGVESVRYVAIEQERTDVDLSDRWPIGMAPRMPSPGALSSQQGGVLCDKVTSYDNDYLHARDRAHRGRDNKLGFLGRANDTLYAEGSGLGGGGDRRDRVEESYMAGASLFGSFVAEGERPQPSIPEGRNTKLVVEGSCVRVTGDRFVDEGCTAPRQTDNDISGFGGGLGVARSAKTR